MKKKKGIVAMNIRWLVPLLLLAALSPAWAQTCISSIAATTPSARFTDHGDGTVTDGRTGLMWERCVLGQTWSGGTCTGSYATFTWSQALGAAESRAFAGHSDWRLPNIKELASIVEMKCYSPASNLAVFPNTPSNAFWSASPVAGDSFYAWGVYFGSGYDNTGGQDNAMGVRVVRGGQSVGPLVTPEQPVYSLPPPVTQPKDKSRNLVLLIHGWNSSPADWADGMKQSIIDKFPTHVSGTDPCFTPIETDSATWQICTFKWSNLAESPWTAWSRAKDVGKYLAKERLIGKYDFIHFIAHSAGSRVASEAAKLINLDSLDPPVVHATFLDAYDPRGNLSDYGDATHWAEQYFDTRPIGLHLLGELDQTKIHLRKAYNFDVTALDPYDPSPDPIEVAGAHAHAWPYQWYRSTVDDPAIFEDGFALSRESGNSLLPSHSLRKRGHTCSYSSVIDRTCSENGEPELIINGNIACTNVLQCYTTDINALIKSDTGTVSLPAPDLIKLINGSPVWTKLPLEISGPVNFLSFNHAYRRDAEGLLSVFFDDQLIYQADQRLDQTGVANHSGNVPIGEVAGGSHSLTIRLDAYNGTQSEIDISNIQLGRMEAIPNASGVPSLAVLSPNGGEVWTVRSRREIRWASSGIPDNGRVKIYFSGDDGANWKLLKRSRMDRGVAVWAIHPRAATTQGLIKACWKEPRLPETVCDVSDSPFRINKRPVANAGANQAVETGQEVSLNGAESLDPDNIPSPLSYQWTQVKGPIVTLGGANTVAPYFTPTTPGLYVFKLVVNDGAADSRRDLVEVRVRLP
ncbi:MAG TPA: DUF1566 domain-containing protein [Methylococcaceae bacterium]|nr:DUF1566 domain-containing protein [Methylococcaceae bacterium]